MISRLNATALATVLVLSGGIAPAFADEASELRAAVTALQKRLDQLEAKAKEAEDTNDKQTDLIAKTRNSVGAWVGNFTWKGDLRYRNEDIDQEFVEGRNRDRIRVRAGFVAKINDTLKTELQLATAEGGDPRSSNQTLTGENTRKPINLDLAYVEWQPTADWKFTGGKMKYPWVRPGQSVLFDGDVNPEGLAVNFGHGGLFASVFYNILEERAPSATVKGAESTMAGGQVGYRFNIGSASRLTLGSSYFSFNAVQNRNTFFVNSAAGANGNTTKTAGCYYGATVCLTSDYKIWEAFGELGTTIASRPLTVYVDYANNSEAINDFDTAYSAGLLFGRASDPHTWEIGYVWQHVEKDSVFGQFVDSDFGGGNTDAQGSILKAAYAPARNWTINATYFLNQTNIDVPVAIAGQGTVFDRDYKRLQIDLNFKY